MNKKSNQAALSQPPARTRIADLARAAKVSTATVDRVLNQRGGVRQSTRQRVFRAAVELDYLDEKASLILAPKPPMRLVFLLPKGSNRWIYMLGDAIDSVKHTLAPFNLQCRCVYVEGFDAEALAQSLLKNAEHADGIAFVALEHPRIREAVQQLAEQGLPVLTMISDLPDSKRIAYVGLDNHAAGRTAGLLLGRFLGKRRGKIAMIAGCLNYRGHEEREIGFQEVLHESLPHLPIVGLREGFDDAQRTYEQSKALLAQHADLIGIYNIGGASDSVARALKEAHKDQEIIFIGHEIMADNRGFLIDGTMDAVLSQSQHAEVMNAMRIFVNLREARKPLHGIEPVRIDIILKENLP